MAGMSDVFGRLNLGLALWNGRDPILKERMFGLTNSEGNHGEDVKEYWWYLDAVPSSAWLKWRYHYPQAAFPYERSDRGERPPIAARAGVRAARHRHLRRRPVLDRRGRLREGRPDRHPGADHRPQCRARRGDDPRPADALVPQRVVVGSRRGPSPSLTAAGGGRPDPGVAPRPRRLRAPRRIRAGRHAAGPAVLRERDERARGSTDRRRRRRGRRTGSTTTSSAGAATVNPALTGTKAAAWYRLTVAPGATAEIRLRLRPRPPASRRGEAAEERTAGRRPSTTTMAARRGRGRRVLRRPAPRRTPPTTRRWSCARRSPACSGASSTTPTTSAAGSTATRPARRRPPERQTGRNAAWRHFDAADILSMPDKWEYPWFAAWDLAFHAVTLAHVDPAFAKYQLLVMCREWFQHPNGALPAYEWSFDDVNPPVHALAAMEVWRIDGERDTEFLEADLPQAAAQLHVVAEPRGRRGQRPVLGRLPRARQPERARPVAPAGRRAGSSSPTRLPGCTRTACRCCAMARELARHDPAYADLVTTFLERAVRIAGALNKSGLWDETDGFFYDSLRLPDGTAVALRIHSMVGLLPMLPAVVVPRQAAELGAALGKHFARFLASAGVTDEALRIRGSIVEAPGGEAHDPQPAAAGPPRAGARARHCRRTRSCRRTGCVRCRDATCAEPFQVEIEGYTASIDYEPGESTTGPLRRQLELAGAGLVPGQLPLHRVAAAAGTSALGEDVHGRAPDRLRAAGCGFATWPPISPRGSSRSGCPDAEGRRPVAGRIAKFRDDPEWRDLLLFHEYFHGDTGAGIGASHQTGWTGLVAHLLCRGGPLDTPPTDRSTLENRGGRVVTAAPAAPAAPTPQMHAGARVRRHAARAGRPRPCLADRRRRGREPEPVGRQRRAAVDRRGVRLGQVQLNLVAVGYSLGLAGSVLWLGALGDRYGRKLMLLLGHRALDPGLPAGRLCAVDRGPRPRPDRRRLLGRAWPTRRRSP